MALLLCGIMATAQTSFTVRAETPIRQGGLCEHHPVHTQECGYIPADPGAPCTHTHDDSCFISVKNCIHDHTDECYSESETDPEATPAAARRREPVNCTHVCSAESGCITKKTNCTHVHDSACGYRPAKPGSPCTFHCDICSPDAGQPDNSTPPHVENLPADKQESCTCNVRCTADAVYTDCAVCGGENGDLSMCTGKETKAASVYSTARDPMNVYTYSQFSNSDTSGDGSVNLPYNRFEDAMENVADGGTIYILYKAFLNDQGNYKTYVFDKNVTIRPAPGQDSASLLVRSSGIALGADVTIENVTLSLSSKVRAAIFANGHHLTLSNIKRGAGARVIHLYAGGTPDSSGYSGDHGAITVTGSCELGNIYGGGLESESGDAHILINKGSKTGNIYACGSDRSNFDPDNMFDMTEPPDPVANPKYTSGSITIDLANGHTVKAIEGAGASSTYVTACPVYPASMALTDITGLTLTSGTIMATSLTGSAGGSIDIDLQNGSALDMSGLNSLPAVGTLKGSGGTFILKQDVCLTANTFTGRVRFAAGSYFNGKSGRVTVGHTYLQVTDPNSDGKLDFTPNDSQTNITMKRKGDSWVASEVIISPSQVTIDITHNGATVNQAFPMQTLNITARAERSGKAASEAPKLNEMRLLINGTPIETKNTDAAGTAVFSPLSVLPSTGFQPGGNTVSVEYGGGDVPEDLDSSTAKAVLYVNKVPVELKNSSYPSVSYNGQSQIPEYTLVLSNDKTEVLPELLPAKDQILFTAGKYKGAALSDEVLTDVVFPGKYKLSWQIPGQAQWLAESTLDGYIEITPAVPVLSASYQVTDKEALKVLTDITVTGVDGGNVPSGDVTVRTAYGTEKTAALQNGHTQIECTMPVAEKTAFEIYYHEPTADSHTAPVYSDAQIHLDVDLSDGGSNHGGDSGNNGGSGNNGSSGNNGGSGNNSGGSSGGGSGRPSGGGGGSSSGGGGGSSSGGGGSSRPGSGGPGGSTSGPSGNHSGSLGDAEHGGSGSWQKNEKGWWYGYADGTWEAGHMNPVSGQEQVAWQNINGKWWAFDHDGYVETGWVLDQSSNQWYWIDQNSGMQSGWQDFNGKWYYFNTDSTSANNRPYGSMYKNEKTPDGYFVNPDGSWDGSAPV